MKPKWFMRRGGSSGSPVRVGIRCYTPAGAPTDKENDPFMKKEWAEAIKANKPELAYSNFGYAGQLTETMLMGNIAVRFAGTKLEWDATKLQFTNSADATKLVSKEYRKGWDFLTMG